MYILSIYKYTSVNWLTYNSLVEIVLQKGYLYCNTNKKLVDNRQEY